jgi:hypothetical protein
MQGDKN